MLTARGRRLWRGDGVPGPPEVTARLDSLAKEWRESRLPPEMTRLGIREYTLRREGPRRYWLACGMPGRILHACGTFVDVVEDRDGTVLRIDVRLSPGYLGAAAVYSAMLALVAALVSIGEPVAWGRYAFAVVAGAGLAMLGYLYAERHLPARAEALVALLRQAAGPRAPSGRA